MSWQLPFAQKTPNRRQEGFPRQTKQGYAAEHFLFQLSRKRNAKRQKKHKKKMGEKQEAPQNEDKVAS